MTVYGRKKKDNRGLFFLILGWKNLTGALIMEEIFRLEDNGYMLSQKPITRKHLSNGKILICDSNTMQEMSRGVAPPPNPL